MADEGSFGAGLADFGNAVGNLFSGGASAPAGPGASGDGMGTDVLPPNAQATEGQAPAGFGSGLGPPRYSTAPTPPVDPLDSAANMLEQRIKRAEQVGSNPILQIMNPEQAMKARDFVPAATEKLLQIKQQKATINANRQQAVTLGLDPGDVPDEATKEQRVEYAQQRAMTGDLRVFKGLQAVDPKAAEAIAPQVYEASAQHLDKAQYAFDKLSNMSNQGEYEAAVRSLQKEGALSSLQTLGLKIPPNYAAFNAQKAREGQALREARIGMNDVRTRLEERNTYQPMEKKEAETYDGRLTTAFGDQIKNGTWSRNAAAGTRGFIVNGASDPRKLGETFTLATPEQRKAIKEEFEGAVPKEELHKFREFGRTYKLATTDAKGNEMPEGKINTNPNVQQGVAEGLASMLRGGAGGANIGLLKIELEKRGWAQQAIDGVVSNYAGAMNTLFSNAKSDKPYLSETSQRQIRDVMDVLKTYNDQSIGDRAGEIAKRAGALGLDASVLGFGHKESAGGIDTALKEGRDAQIARMLPFHQAIGGGDGVFQLGAQRPGAGAAPMPPGTGAAAQQPGAPALATPVQQATMQPGTPPATPVPSGGPAPLPGGTAPVTPAGGSPLPSSPGGGAPISVAGQNVSVALPPGASPQYVNRMQRIESGGEKDPWTSGTPNSSAGGAFQFINSTWKANKPPGAPDRARDATPEQQAAALATFTAKNAAALTRNGLPVNDTTLYIAHNLGDGGAQKLLTAPADGDARAIVGEKEAANNPAFFKGRPKVETVLARYRAKVEDADLPPSDGGPKTPAGSGGAAAEPPSLLRRISRALMQGVPENERDASLRNVGEGATDAAPAIGSTLGAIGGSVAGPVGTVAGGAAGGGAGQAVKDYLQGNVVQPTKIAKEAALGGVLGVGTAARPVVSAVARAAGAGAVEAGDAAIEGKDASEIADAGAKGAGLAAVGETFGRALGMAGHKVFSMFGGDAQKAVQAAATKLDDAERVLKSEPNRLPGVNGAAGGPNPKYIQAEQAKGEAETVLRDAGLKPEEAAYAARVSAEGVPKQEAQVMRPAALEKDRVGAGYQQLENEVGAAGKGALKPTPKLPDGPRAMVENKQVSAKHAELAERVEAAITSPAPDWKTKWTQLKDARSDLLQAERDALNSTAPGKTREAQDMRVLADSVRKQQEKAAEYVFGKTDGEAFMKRLRVLDTRYRNLMDATNGGDIAKAATMKGEAGREAEKKFVAFAHDDKDAIAAYRAMRGMKGDAFEATVPWTVAAEGIPGIGKVVKLGKLAGMMREWARERAAGSPVTFADLVKMNQGAETRQMSRDIAGTAVQRGMTMSGDQQQ